MSIEKSLQDEKLSKVLKCLAISSHNNFCKLIENLIEIAKLLMIPEGEKKCYTNPKLFIKINMLTLTNKLRKLNCNYQPG